MLSAEQIGVFWRAMASIELQIEKAYRVNDNVGHYSDCYFD